MILLALPSRCVEECSASPVRYLRDRLWLDEYLERITLTRPNFSACSLFIHFVGFIDLYNFTRVTLFPIIFSATVYDTPKAISYFYDTPKIVLVWDLTSYWWWSRCRLWLEPALLLTPALLVPSFSVFALLIGPFRPVLPAGAVWRRGFHFRCYPGFSILPAWTLWFFQLVRNANLFWASYA